MSKFDLNILISSHRVGKNRSEPAVSSRVIVSHVVDELVRCSDVTTPHYLLVLVENVHTLRNSGYLVWYKLYKLS